METRAAGQAREHHAHQRSRQDVQTDSHKSISAIRTTNKRNSHLRPSPKRNAQVGVISPAERDGSPPVEAGRIHCRDLEHGKRISPADIKPI
jgi:hypothetical protein